MSTKITLITGASRGIGRATAELLARQGHQVCVNYHRNHAKAHEVVSAIKAQGGRAIAMQADIADEAQVIAMFAQIDEQLGQLTGLVNNAAMLFPQSAIEQLSYERLARIFAVNAIGSFLCCREAVKRMSTKQGGMGGAIVNVSSAAARLGAPNEYIDYAASKGAMDSLTRGLSLEVAEAIAWLLSHQASYVTGTFIELAGGK